MATGNTTTIGSDDEAVAALQAALRAGGMPSAALAFRAWPTIDFKLEGEDFDGTINAAVAEAILEAQRAINATYLHLVKPYASRLDAEEKRKIEVQARVERGSSLVSFDFSSALTEIAKHLTSAMTGPEIVTTVLGSGLLIGASFVARAYVKHRAEGLVRSRELDHALAMSSEETRKMQLVADAIERQSALRQVKDDFDEVRNDVLRAGATADRMVFEGVRLNADDARRLARQPRGSATDEQLNGVYQIDAVTWPSDDEAVLRLRAAEGAEEFNATLATRSLTEADKQLLAAAEWNRQPVYFSVNAKRLHGRVSAAVIVGLDWERLRNYVAQQRPAGQ